MTWSEEIVDRLCALRLLSDDFEACWARALREVPPYGRECRAGGVARSLFDGVSEGERFVAFVQRACSDAWHGRRPALMHLATALDNQVLPGLDSREPSTRRAARGRVRPASLTASAS